jgi:K+-transporting ATPase ATPase C chain
MLRPAILLFILLSLITGGLYPLVTTALGQWWFKDQANGSLIMQNGENRGSRLIGQNFTDARYFQGRPSATAESPYNPMASGGSNLAAATRSWTKPSLSAWQPCAPPTRRPAARCRSSW